MSSRAMRRSLRSRSSTQRSLRPRIDHLESRSLLSTTPLMLVAHPTFEIGSLAGGSEPPSGAYTPAQIQLAYGFNNITFGGVAGNGSGETIAIVDAYDDPNIQSDLNTFDSEFGLPATTVTRVNETGGTSYPASDSTGGWEFEESLDVEWAHAMAPGASIMLVEASSDSNSDLLAGVQYAAAHANVVSMSWGGSEFAGETAYDTQYFDQAGVTFVASSGDDRCARRVAGGFTERSVRRRDGPDPRPGQCLVERGRLEWQRRRPQRLRVATVLPEWCGDADVVGASHPGRRL